MGIPERKEREKQMRHDAILAASQSVFLNKGLYGATLDEIAEKAEVSKGTIYLYFRSKEDLYFSLMALGLRKLLLMFEATGPEERSPSEIIHGFAEAYRNFSRKENYLFKMLAMVESPVANEQVSPDVLSELEKVSDEVLSYVAKFVQKGMEAGDFRKELSSYEAVILFWVSLSGVLNLKGRAESMRDNKYISKESFLHQVEYDLLYDKCVTFLVSLLLSRDPKDKSSREVHVKTKKMSRRLKGVKKK